MAKRFPSHGSCFVCGDENPCGIGAILWVDDDGSIFTDVTYDLKQQGPPGHAHGGATAALLDEVMGMCCWRAGYKVMSVHLEVDYEQAVPLGVQVHAVGRIAKVEGNAVHTEGELTLPDGTVAVRGRGVYANVPEKIEAFARAHGLSSDPFKVGDFG